MVFDLVLMIGRWWCYYIRLVIDWLGDEDDIDGEEDLEILDLVMVVSQSVTLVKSMS